MDTSVRGVLAAARERFTSGDYYGAIHCLDDVTGSGRSYADVHHLRGVCFSLLARPDDALAEFDRALTINPRYVEALLHRGVVLNQLGRTAEAEETLGRARAAEGQPVGGLSAPVAARIANELARLADLYAEVGALPDAVELLRRAVALGPAFLDLRLRLARLLVEAGNPLEARECLEAILRERPDWIEARIQLGLVNYLAGDAARAREIWQACQADHPEYPGIHAYLTMVERIPE